MLGDSICIKQRVERCYVPRITIFVRIYKTECKIVLLAVLYTRSVHSRICKFTAYSLLVNYFCYGILFHYGSFHRYLAFSIFPVAIHSQLPVYSHEVMSPSADSALIHRIFLKGIWRRRPSVCIVYRRSKNLLCDNSLLYNITCHLL